MIHPRRSQAQKDLETAVILSAIIRNQAGRIAIKSRLPAQPDINSFVFD